ncbi:hypothetical protein K8I28_17295 [bacterium]|nr:hypothetical protein [bacterium]
MNRSAISVDIADATSTDVAEHSFILRHASVGLAGIQEDIDIIGDKK